MPARIDARPVRYRRPVVPRAASAQVRAERSQKAAQDAVQRVEDTARGDGNLMPAILDAVRAYATLGEISDAMRRVFGEHRPSVTL